MNEVKLILEDFDYIFKLDKYDCGIQKLKREMLTQLKLGQPNENMRVFADFDTIHFVDAILSQHSVGF